MHEHKRLVTLLNYTCLKMPFFAKTIAKIQISVKHFSKSNKSKEILLDFLEFFC